MKHKPSYKPEIKIRRSAPRVQETTEAVLILCPFCNPPHPVAVGKPASCGTSLEVTAVQTIVPERTVRRRKLTCLKCGQGGGEMVPYYQGWIHLVDCVPGTTLLAEPPGKYSRWAQMVYRLPSRMRTGVERWTGKARMVEEMDSATGKPTGRVLGYLFQARGGAA